MQAAHEFCNTTTTKKKTDKNDEADANSQSIPRVPCNKLNYNPGNGKHQKTDILIAAHSTTVYSARRQDTPISGQCLTPVSSVINLTMPIPRRTWIDVYISTMMLPRSS